MKAQSKWWSTFTGLVSLWAPATVRRRPENENLILIFRPSPQSFIYPFVDSEWRVANNSLGRARCHLHPVIRCPPPESWRPSHLGMLLLKLCISRLIFNSDWDKERNAQPIPLMSVVRRRNSMAPDPVVAAYREEEEEPGRAPAGWLWGICLQRTKWPAREGELWKRWGIIVVITLPGCHRRTSRR